MSMRLYAGRAARTRRELIVYRCVCGESFRAEVWRAVSSTDPSETARLKEGRLNQVACPACQATAEVQVSVLFHDVEAPRLVLVLPDSLRHRELEERAELFSLLASDREPAPAYVTAAEVAFGAAALRALDEARPPASPPAEKESPTQVRSHVPDARLALVERWIAGREAPQAFVLEERALICAALPPEALASFVPGPLELRVQLHRLPTYPIVSLTVIAEDGESGTAPSVVLVALDVARAAHRAILDVLGRRTALTVELYDLQYRPVAAHRLSAPLEENVRRLSAEARDAFERIAPASRSFERARETLTQPGYDRLGRTPVDLPDGELEPLHRPGAVLAALRAIERWSQPGAEAYLVEVRAVPLERWRAARARVVARALALGLAVPRPLVEETAAGGPPEPWPERVAESMRRFAQVSLRAKPNDLSAAEEAENWQKLLAECRREGVEVDTTLRELAAASLKRARARQTGGIDLRTLETHELEALLDRKELRREAAIILCERRETPSLPLVFAALRRMSRAEVNRVLPAACGFGPGVEKWLIEGLGSRRSFMRQGSALALGVVKGERAAGALASLLVAEPTEIWSEVALALGEVGPAAVAPLLRELEVGGADREERILQALAQVAARGSQTAVEGLLGSPNPAIARAAGQALALAAGVPAKETFEGTGVRSFSRRFYEAIGGEAIELSPEDLTEDAAEEPPVAAENDDRSDGVRRLAAPVLDERTLPSAKTSLPRSAG